jgi:hypothetical protein
MSVQQLLTDAKNTVFELKKEEQRNINPYASFANQVIWILEKPEVKSRADVLEYTRLSYPRPGLNKQWRIFGRVLEKNLRDKLDKEDIARYFGYLKRLLTIEGKNQSDERNSSFHKRDNKPHFRIGKR